MAMAALQTGGEARYTALYNDNFLLMRVNRSLRSSSLLHANPMVGF